MNRSKFQLFLLITTLVCLISLVGIQINWVLKEARLQEAQFNRSVGMALKRIENNLERYKDCTLQQKCSSCKLLTSTLKQAANLDSIIRSDLNYYGINLDFDYGIVDLKSEKVKTQKGCYVTSNLAEILQQSGYELKINFPKKRDFILAQIGTIFITSIILVILVTVSFLLIFRFYRKERLLSEHVRDFINNMTHEFKTPLTNIGFANSMLSKHELIETNPKLSSYTGIIRDEHKRLKERVELLLKTSQSDTILPTSLETVDLAKVVEDVVESFQTQIDEKQGTISIHKSGDDFILKSNIDQLHIAIGNLIDNALKYCDKTPRIDIQLKSKFNSLTIEIIDNGVGISTEHLQKVFDKFYRIPQGDIHDIKGFGLGLNHVKTIIERLGGKITVNSIKGKGTTFTIDIPRNNE